MMKSSSVDLKLIRRQINKMFDKEMHLKRQHSLADAAFGLLNSDSLRLHALGEGLALGKGLDKKHTTKQIDRLLSNSKLDNWAIAEYWVPYLIGERQEIEVALDWTSFWHDSQQTLCLNLLTKQGRATPLLWKSVTHTQLKHNRGRFEDQMLSRLKEVLPNDVKVLLVADRGFASFRFFAFIESLGFDYIIRLKSGTTVMSAKGTTHTAKDWLRSDGRALAINHAMITAEQFPVKQVIITKDKGMKDMWCLACNRNDLKTREIINGYARRWKIEPYFRDVKDQRFGFGLAKTHIKSPERRDRLFFIVAIAYVLLTLLGAAGEQLGFDRKLKVNTVKTRTHSLIRQGMFYYDFYQHFKDHEKLLLHEKFNDLLQQHAFWNLILADI